jgi:hypothetical protein
MIKKSQYSIVSENENYYVRRNDLVIFGFPIPFFSSLMNKSIGFVYCRSFATSYNSVGEAQVALIKQIWHNSAPIKRERRINRILAAERKVGIVRKTIHVPPFIKNV